MFLVILGYYEVLNTISEMPSVLMQADWLLVVDTVIRLWRVYHLL